MAKELLLNIDNLRKRFEYLPDSGLILAKVGNETYRPYVSGKAKMDYPGFSDIREGMPVGDECGGYYVIKYAGKKINAHRIAWALHYGEWPDGNIDHINRDGLDNRIDNLRIATKAQNARNRSSVVGSTSMYLGVFLAKGRWIAQISHAGKTTKIGSFDSEEAAAIAYDCAAIVYHREFANPNIIENPFLQG